MPAHPKLRSSCDGCGTAKVKCDRTQPECGRCASHSMKCVYGISRKMGKPPREKMRLKTSSNKPSHDGLRGAGPPPLGPGKMLDSVYGSLYPGHGSSLHHGHGGGLHHGLHGNDFGDYHHPSHAGLVAGLHCGPEAHMEDVLASWEPLEHDQHQHQHAGSFLVNMDALDPLYGDYIDPSLPLFAAPNFGGEWGVPPDPPAATATACGGGGGGGFLGSQPGMEPYGPPLSTPASPLAVGDTATGPAWSHSSSNSSTTATGATTRSDSVTSPSSSPSTSTDGQGGGGGGGHDCARAAHNILESLSPPRLGRLLGAPSSWDAAAASFTTTATPGPSGGSADVFIPLDAVLQLNREASGRLARLLACRAGCARAPALALLYASIVARVLAWYQQAAASCAAAVAASSPSWNGGGGGGGGTFPAQDTKPITGAAMTGPPWDATIVVADGTGLPPSGETTTTIPGGDPHAMALGAFSIDDLRVQGALKMQLLAGEMRRAARLIDKFAAFAAATTAATKSFSSATSSSSSSASATSSSASSSLALASPASPLPPAFVLGGGGGSDDTTLCLGLEAWLRGEHARIDGLLRAQLRDICY